MFTDSQLQKGTGFEQSAAAAIANGEPRGACSPFPQAPNRAPRPLKPGVAVVAFVAALLIIGTFVLWLLSLAVSSSSASLGHLQGCSAFYAAEGGIELALRELSRSPPVDIDSDGTIATISDNGNPADDPATDAAAVYVQRLGTTPPTLRAVGRPSQTASSWSEFRRIVEVRTR